MAQLGPYVHADTTARLQALDRVAAATGSSRNQVVLAALIHGSPRCRPIVGVSSISQLEEAAAAHRVHVDAEARTVLDLPI